MSYDIYLYDDKDAPVQFESAHQITGGTYCVGGTDLAWLNVTWNYARHFNFRGLHGRGAQDTIPELEQAVRELGTERSADYWEPTPGNAGAAVAGLLEMAKAAPWARWEVHT